jgi:DUF1365 family protein
MNVSHLIDQSNGGEPLQKPEVKTKIQKTKHLTPKLNSAIYSGWVEHIRHKPSQHHFQYQVFMMYLDLDELDEVLAQSALWSKKFWAPARFKRSDFLGDATKPLKQEVLQIIKDKTGETFQGSVRILCNLRYFGFIINPITCYYCFDENEQLKFLVAEVTNTPWDKKVCYVLSASPHDKYLECEFKKEMHVSPFNPMDMIYRWRSNKPSERLFIHLSNFAENSPVMDANVYLKREEISSGTLMPGSLTKKLIQYPFMTVKIALGIYWQALKLFIKRVPVFRNPHK